MDIKEKEIFATYHIVIQKNISTKDVFKDISDILESHGYCMVGAIGTTECIYSGKKELLLSEVLHRTFLKHYKSIKNAW